MGAAAEVLGPFRSQSTANVGGASERRIGSRHTAGCVTTPKVICLPTRWHMYLLDRLVLTRSRWRGDDGAESTWRWLATSGNMAEPSSAVPERMPCPGASVRATTKRESARVDGSGGAIPGFVDCCANLPRIGGSNHRCGLKAKFESLMVAQGRTRRPSSVAHKMLRIIYAMLSNRGQQLQGQHRRHEALTVAECAALEQRMARCWRNRPD